MTQQQINTLFAEIEGIKFYHVTTAWPDDSINKWVCEERILWTKFSLAHTNRLPQYVFDVKKLFKDPEEAPYARKFMECLMTGEEAEVLQAIVDDIDQHYLDSPDRLPKILEAVEAQKEKVPNLAEKLRKGQAWETGDMEEAMKETLTFAVKAGRLNDLIEKAKADGVV